MDMIEDIARWLKIAGFHVLRAQNAARFPRDSGTFVTVGEGKTSAVAFLNPYMGMDEEQTDHYGRLLRTQLTFEVYTAREKGAAVCDAQTALLTVALCAHDAPFYCMELSTQPVRYDDDTRCFCRSVTASYMQWLCTGEE